MRMWSLALVLAGGACAPTAQPVVFARPAPAALAEEGPACRAFTATALAAGEPRIATGQVCQQADGRWRIVAETPTPEAAIAMAIPEPDEAMEDKTVYYPFDPRGHASSFLSPGYGSGYHGYGEAEFFFFGDGFHHHRFHHFFGGFGGPFR